MKWYVLKAISGKEKKAKSFLEIEIKNNKLENYITEVLVPTEKVIQIRNGKKIIKERVILSGYVIIKAILEGEAPTVIKNTPNILGFLSIERGGDPIPMHESELQRLVGKSDESLNLEEQLNANFTIGENIKIIDGPFNTFEGIIEEVEDDKKKLKVMIKIFGRKTPVELNYSQVEK